MKNPAIANTITMDWFQATLIGKLVQYDTPLESYKYDNGRILLAKRKAGTKHYQYVYDITVQGKPFAVICCCPRNTAILDKDFINYKAVNNTLYEVGYIARFEQLLQVMKWKVKNVSRVDIALDGHEYVNIMYKAASGEINRVGRAQANIYYNAKMKATGWDLGSKASNKWVTCYNKTKELNRSNKHYIKRFWKRSGLDLTEDIHRLELKLRNDAVKQIKDFDWKRLDDFEYLASMLRTHFTKFFEFRENTGKSNISREKVIEYIDWESIGAVKLEKLSTIETTEVWGMKLAAKRMFWCYLATNKNHYVDLGREIAMNINCIQWFIDNLDKWKREFEMKCGHNKDGLVHFNYFPVYRTYEENEQLKLYKAEVRVTQPSGC